MLQPDARDLGAEPAGVECAANWSTEGTQSATSTAPFSHGQPIDSVGDNGRNSKAWPCNLCDRSFVRKEHLTRTSLKFRFNFQVTSSLLFTLILNLCIDANTA
jgi:hypothetical protein